MTVIIVYTTDAHHSHASKDFLAVFSSRQKAIEGCKKHAKENKPILSMSDINNLSAFNQTQGREVNYLLDEATVNPKTF